MSAMNAEFFDAIEQKQVAEQNKLRAETEKELKQLRLKLINSKTRL